MVQASGRQRPEACFIAMKGLRDKEFSSLYTFAVPGYEKNPCAFVRDRQSTGYII